VFPSLLPIRTFWCRVFFLPPRSFERVRVAGPAGCQKPCLLLVALGRGRARPRRVAVTRRVLRVSRACRVSASSHPYHIRPLFTGQSCSTWIHPCSRSSTTRWCSSSGSRCRPSRRHGCRSGFLWLVGSRDRGRAYLVVGAAVGDFVGHCGVWRRMRMGMRSGWEGVRGQL
jgi:hypothetical protein